MSSPKLVRPALSRLSNIAVFIFAAISIVWGKDFQPPAATLDPSWREALVQATDQGLRFGKDIVFTFGPFHQLYTNAIGDNLHALIFGRWIYGIAWGAAVVGIADLSSAVFGWLFVIFMAFSGSISDDVSFYALQLAFLLIASKQIRGKQWPQLAMIYCGVVVSIFCKLSFAVSAGPVIICVAILLARNSLRTMKSRIATILFAVTIPPVIWLVSGQALTSLFGYLMGPNLSVVLGYSSAMASDDASAGWQIPAYWIGAIALTFVMYKAVYSRLQSRRLSFLITSCSLFLFWTSFKAGMVRHDGHAAIAGLALASFALIILGYASHDSTDELALFSTIGALTLGLSIVSQYFSPIRSRLDQWLVSQFKNAYLFAQLIPSGSAKQQLEVLRQEGFVRLKSRVENLSLIPRGSTADALPWDITDLPANGLRYQPRPVIQSYSAYTPNLQDLNRQHFESAQAPSYLVLNAFSIDGRNPPDLDYPSLEVIASRYQFVGIGGKNGLILKRKEAGDSIGRLRWDTINFGLPGDKISPVNTVKEHWIRLPNKLRPGSRFSITIRPASWRRFQGIAFKPSPLAIAIKFEDGRILAYRVLEAASRQIPLYPFVENSPTLREYLFAAQGISANKLALGSKPVAIRFLGSLSAQGLKYAQLTVEQPIFQ